MALSFAHDSAFFFSLLFLFSQGFLYYFLFIISCCCQRVIWFVSSILETSQSQEEVFKMRTVFELSKNAVLEPGTWLSCNAETEAGGLRALQLSLTLELSPLAASWTQRCLLWDETHTQTSHTKFLDSQNHLGLGKYLWCHWVQQLTQHHQVYH